MAQRQSAKRVYIWAALLAFVCSGCGSPQTATDSTDSSSNQPDSQQPADTTIIPNLSDTQPADSDDQVWVDKNGRRFIGRVPYDVFFDNPVELAGSSQPITGAATDAPSTDSANAAPAGGSESAATNTDGQSHDWERWLPLDVLESEVKAARNYLNQKLQSVGSYNTAVTMIPPQAGTIAVLAGIAEEHSGTISWQEDASLVRDLAAQMTASPLKRGPKDQRRLLEHFEDMTDTLNRSRPAGLEIKSADAEWAETAEMGLVMSRLETASQRLRTEVTESGFATQQKLVRHEASLVAGLMKAMTTESYGFADDTDFLAHSNALMDAGLKMREAGESGDFTRFELSVSAMATACQACHRDYRTN